MSRSTQSLCERMSPPERAAGTNKIDIKAGGEA